jgi:hypothetical protein
VTSHVYWKRNSQEHRQGIPNGTKQVSRRRSSTKCVQVLPCSDNTIVNTGSPHVFQNRLQRICEVPIQVGAELVVNILEAFDVHSDDGFELKGYDSLLGRPPSGKSHPSHSAASTISTTNSQELQQITVSVAQYLARGFIWTLLVSIRARKLGCLSRLSVRVNDGRKRLFQRRKWWP